MWPGSRSGVRGGRLNSSTGEIYLGRANYSSPQLGLLRKHLTDLVPGCTLLFSTARQIF